MALQWAISPKPSFLPGMRKDLPTTRGFSGEHHASPSGAMCPRPVNITEGCLLRGAPWAVPTLRGAAESSLGPPHFQAPTWRASPKVQGTPPE